MQRDDESTSTLMHEGVLDLPPGTTKPERLLALSLERAAQMGTDLAIVCMISGPQLDVMCSGSLSHMELAALFDNLAENHRRQAEMPPEPKIEVAH